MSKSNNKTYTIQELFPDNNFSNVTGLDLKKRIADMISITDLSLIKLLLKKRVIKDEELIESYSPQPTDKVTVYVSKPKSLTPTSSSELSPSNSLSSSDNLQTNNAPQTPPLLPQQQPELFNAPLNIPNQPPNIPQINNPEPLLNPGNTSNFAPTNPEVQPNVNDTTTPFSQYPSFPNTTLPGPAPSLPGIDAGFQQPPISQPPAQPPINPQSPITPPPQPGDSELQSKIQQVIEIAQCSEEIARNALLMVGQDVQSAINLVFENPGAIQSQPQVSPNQPIPDIPQYTENIPNVEPPNIEPNHVNQLNDDVIHNDEDISNEDDTPSPINYSNYPGYKAVTDTPTNEQPKISTDTSFAPPPSQNSFPKRTKIHGISFVPHAELVPQTNDTPVPQSLAIYSAPQPISSTVTQVAPPEQRGIADFMHNMMGKSQMGMPSMASPGALSMFHGMHGTEIGMESLMSEQGFGSQSISSPSPNYSSMSSMQSSFAGSGLTSGGGGLGGMGGLGDISGLSGLGGFGGPSAGGGGFGMGGPSPAPQQPQVNPLINNYSPNEQNELMTLFREFPNTNQQEIIGLYEACGKDINQARALVDK